MKSIWKFSFNKVLPAVSMALVISTMLIALPPKEAFSKKIEAKCENSISDASTINNAIASSQVGDEIVIQGQCLINQVITLLGNRSYRGESRTGTVLKQAEDANLGAILASDGYMNNTTYTGNPVSIRQFTIDGNKTNNTTATNGINLRSWQSTVNDLQIKNMGGHGIRLTNKSENGTAITNTQVNGQIIGNYIMDSGGHGVWIEDSGNSVTDWQLMDNWIGHSGMDGINMDNAAGWNIERNHLYGVPQNAIYAKRLYGTTIADNYIEDFGSTSTNGTYYGIRATIQGSGAPSQISGNKVQGKQSNAGSTYRFISASANYGTGVVSVFGNAVRGAGKANGTGLHYTAGSYSLLVTSTGNNVFDVNTPITTDTGVNVGSGL